MTNVTVSLRGVARSLTLLGTTVVLAAACAGDAPTALRPSAPALQGGSGSGGGSATTTAPAVANINGNWVALALDATDSKYDQRISLRIDQRGTALSGQYESVYLCCPESNNKYKSTGSIDAAGNVTLIINAGVGDRSVTFNGVVSADRASITGRITNGSGSSGLLTFTR